MSVAEMKLAAFEKLAALQDESSIGEILEHLEKLNSNGPAQSDFLKHAFSVMDDRPELLHKLAQ